ncbi:MAG: hypothetical protein ACFE8E_14295, partial [Candidatus Hodarchaeota archaeon]
MKNSRNKKIYELIIIAIIFLSSIQVLSNQDLKNPIMFKRNDKNQTVYESNRLKSASTMKTNFQIIQEIFTQKKSDYNSLGYFPQRYIPSLQATYYAIFILDALGKLDQINQTELTNYIMAHYDEDLHIFKDEYTSRYLKANYSQMYYALSSMLQIHCYAVLSLEILGNLELINQQECINFIWSCLNTEGVSNGFIGRPYSTELPEYFKTASMDNTYWAIKTLDTLMENWEGYSSEKSRIVQYINSLQCIQPGDAYFGAFDNSLGSAPLPIPGLSLLSSYFSIRSLDILNFLDTVRMEHFHVFLNNLYDENEAYFRMRFNNEDSNIVASAIGLELSNITGYTNISQNDVFQFITENRNELGNWDRSTVYQYHELVDTYRIIKSLKELGQLSQISEEEKNEIVKALNFYKQFKGYSLISTDYSSLDLTTSMINTFSIYDKIPDLDILALYQQIEDCIIYDPFCESYSFRNSINMYSFGAFNSYPIEYLNIGKYDADFITSHKSTFLALDALNKIYKLDDFSLVYDLLDMLDDVIKSQFLVSGYEGYGAFLPRISDTIGTPEYQSKKIYLKYSYFAVKVMEMLSNFMNLGGLYNLSCNKVALYGYITNNTIETESQIFYNSQHSSDELMLRDIYYMVYILKALNLFNLNSQKIKTYVLEKLDYQNIKNVYYAYKISEILNLNIEFDFTLTHSLVKALYSEYLREFYLTTDFECIDQIIFHWVCELAKNDKLKIDCSYIDFLLLGSINTLTTTFNNIILDDFGPGTSVKFESEQLGMLTLEKQISSFQTNFLVPETPKCYPKIDGVLRIYDYAQLIAQKQISIETYFDLIVSHTIIKNAEKVHFELNISRGFFSGHYAVYNSTLRVLIYDKQNYTETLEFSREDFANYSKFNLNYILPDENDYYFNISLYDEFFVDGHSILLYLQRIEHPYSISLTGWQLALIGLICTGGVIGGVKLIGMKIKDRKTGKVRKKGKEKGYKDIEN